MTTSCAREQDIRPANELASKILAFLGSAVLGFVAIVNATIAGVALFSGNLIGALGDAASKSDTDLAGSASHAALVAKVLAIGFAVLAAAEFGAAAFIRHRIRTMFVPITTGVTIAGELTFSIWGGHFTALDAILIGCALCASWIWWQTARRS